MAAFGLAPDEPLEQRELPVWPENWTALLVFRRMLTQLHVGGMGGVIGLRYESLPFVLRVQAVPRADWPELLDCLQLMERHMVQLLNERK